MGIHRLNHAVLHVRDVAVSKRFYMDLLGFRVVTELPRAVFLQAPGSTNDHDLGLFEVGAAAGPNPSGRGTVGLYHLAWEVETLGELEDLSSSLRSASALVGASDHGSTKSLYARDPDGLEFEVVWLIPAADLTDADLAGRDETTELHLPRELERFGRDARSGLGISRSAS
ncbi:MAG: VOC family protein [Ilumatobacter sp.]|uniref:VOC family protein n=1 Tax=Ilumatobacter sp. TaxID=1967498 RepID=UPI0032977DD1